MPIRETRRPNRSQPPQRRGKSELPNKYSKIYERIAVTVAH